MSVKEEIITNKSPKKNSHHNMPISVWLPDAEEASGEANRFETFTDTEWIQKFLNSNSGYWGISSVKGIGKTFVLQVKRSLHKKDAICFPDVKKPSTDNNWATESVRFTNDDIILWRDINVAVIIWKHVFICYVLANIITNEKHNSKPVTNTIHSRLNEFKNTSKISNDTYKFCTEEAYTTLDNIFWEVRLMAKQQRDWKETVYKDYNTLKMLSNQIQDFLKEAKRNEIAIFIDKIDQSIEQANAEMPADCATCDKAKKIENCYSEDMTCLQTPPTCATECCIGCEVYTANHYSPEQNMRIYVESGKSPLEHISMWQYLQMSLIWSAYQIKSDFVGKIRIYYTVREEAFYCESNLMGEHKSKITRNVLHLHYTKDEQRKIFLDSIKNQNDNFLFNPDLKEVAGREEEAFCGISEIYHPYVQGEKETVFDCIYRHSFDRSRDIQLYGDMLTRDMAEIRKIQDVDRRTEHIKSQIEKFAKTMAYDIENDNGTKSISYYHEKIQFIPNYWHIREHIEGFLRQLHYNLLFKDDAVKICKNINEKPNCNGDNCADANCNRHPFSLLINLGLVGTISVNRSNESDVLQDFREAEEVTYIKEKSVKFAEGKTVFLIHPALTKSIELNILYRNINHFNGFIIGKDLTVPKNKLQELFKDKNELSKELFDAKYFNNGNSTPESIKDASGMITTANLKTETLYKNEVILARTTVPLYTGNINDNPEILGTAFYYQCDDKIHIITCGHNLPNNHCDIKVKVIGKYYNMQIEYCCDKSQFSTCNDIAILSFSNFNCTDVANNITAIEKCNTRSHDANYAFGYSKTEGGVGNRISIKSYTSESGSGNLDTYTVEGSVPIGYSGSPIINNNSELLGMIQGWAYQKMLVVPVKNIIEQLEELRRN